MTIFDVHIQVQQMLYSVGIFDNNQIFTEELDIEINNEISQYIDEIEEDVTGVVGFQDKISKLNDIRMLYVIGSTLATTSLSTGRIFSGKVFQLPNDYRFYVSSGINVDVIDQDEKTFKLDIPIVLLDLEYQELLKDTYLYKPKTDAIFAVVEEDKLLLNCNWNINNVRLNYVKEPNIAKLVLDSNGNYDATASVTPQLTDKVLRKIASRTAQRLLKIMEGSQQKIVNLDNE